MALSEETKGKLNNSLGTAAGNQVISHLEGADSLTDFGITSSAAELNILDGATLDVNELNILDGVTATAAELNSTDLTAVGAILKVKRIAISANFDNTEQDSGWDLPAKAIVLDTWVDVTTADTGETLDVGTAVGESGDPNGFLAAVSVNATGIQRGVLTAGGVTLGALMIETVTDSNTDTLSARIPCVSQGGKSVVYTGSSATNTMRGAIYILYIELAA